ncbi:MAG: hypothetical protein K2Q18_13680 [Bdellovibrionales bacterium]|nr:hypothetical protein [Bdellovibrionales bacterium]
MNIKDLLNLNILFVTYGESYGLGQEALGPNLEELSVGMTPDMKLKMKVISIDTLNKVKELSATDIDKRSSLLKSYSEKMTAEEVEMIRIIFENAERKFNKVA